MTYNGIQPIYGIKMKMNYKCVVNVMTSETPNHLIPQMKKGMAKILVARSINQQQNNFLDYVGHINALSYHAARGRLLTIQ